MAGRILYSIARFIVFFLARFMFRMRVYGTENIPSSGGFIIAANHLSYLDIPFLGYSLHRPANYIAKKELFTVPVVGAMLRSLGGIPIDRDKIDRSSLKEIMKRLNAGNIVVIYPEGTRSLNGKLQSGKPGVGFIVRMSGKKVIPAAITGTDKAMPSGSWFIRPYPVTIRFGKPLDFTKSRPSIPPLEKGGKGGFEPAPSDEKQCPDVTITNVIMDNIAALLNTP